MVAAGGTAPSPSAPKAGGPLLSEAAAALKMAPPRGLEPLKILLEREVALPVCLRRHESKTVNYVMGGIGVGPISPDLSAPAHFSRCAIRSI